MHDVAELVEERPHFIVPQQRGTPRGRLREVDHERGHRHHAAPVGQQAAGLQAEAGGVVVFTFPGKEKHTSGP